MIKALNTNAASLLGWNKKQIKGKFLITFIPNEEQDKIWTYLSCCRRAKEPCALDIHLLRTDKTPLPVQIRSFPVKRKQGESLHLALLDFSKQNASELNQGMKNRTLELQKSNDELAVEIEKRKELEQKLRDRMEELNLYDQRRNQFLAMLSHELRNPLGAITNAAEIIRRKGAEDPNLLVWSYQVIRSQANYLSNILRDLLDISRITLGKMILCKESVTLQTIIEHAVESTRSTLENNQNNLTLDMDHTPIWLYVDSTRCTQIIGNLIHNGAKFSGPGSEIKVTVERNGAWSIARVRDYGPGIPKDRLNQVFDLFYQTDDLSDCSKGGLGIGLALARQLAELHGGRIEVNCEGLGQGTEFQVWLPLSLPGS